MFRQGAVPARRVKTGTMTSTKMRAKREKPKAMGRIYVLTIKTWSEWDRAHYTHGRIHWSDEAGHGDKDSESLPNKDGITTIRHNTRGSCLDGARRWFAAHAKPGDALILGVWGLAGWESRQPYEVLEGKVTKAMVRRSADA
jgi:hypothetical protein